jgi:thioredoxin reductase (NADPH)
MGEFDMPENEMYDVIIIGGGPGGLSAAIYAIRAALKVVLIEKGIPGGQINLTDSVENYPAIENISGFELSQKFLDHAKSYGLEVMQQEVAAVDPGLKFHSVRLASGEILNSHAVIMAMGGSPRKLGVPGESEYYGKGVSYCATCDGFFFRGKDVIVVGGGDTALEEAIYLAKIARRVNLAHRRDAFRGSRILQQRAMCEDKINILWNTVITEIKADEQGVNAVVLRNTQTEATQELPTEGVFIFVGFLPNNALVPAGVNTDPNGYVLTNEKCETSLPGIYAIGDLRQKFARQIVTAAADGCTAALAAALKVEMKKAAGNGVFYNL